MTERNIKLVIDGCDLGKDVTVDTETGEVLNASKCNSLNKSGGGKLPDFEVDTRGKDVVGVICRESGNCERCQKRV